jgi:hypothetical protein
VGGLDTSKYDKYSSAKACLTLLINLLHALLDVIQILQFENGETRGRSVFETTSLAIVCASLRAKPMAPGFSHPPNPSCVTALETR